MPIGVDLGQLIKDVRAEAGHSLSPAQGGATQETIIYMLNRTQREFTDAILWPHLKIYRTIPMQISERYYNFPTDLPFENMTEVWSHTVNGTDWRLLPKGISPAQFQIYNSEQGVTAWPALRWDYNADLGQMEIWPIPSTSSGELRVYGQKPPPDMVKLTDLCGVDSIALTMFVAAELLTRAGSKEADIRTQKAQRQLTKLQGKYGARKAAWTDLTGGNRGQGRPPVLGLDYIPQGYTYPGQVT